MISVGIDVSKGKSTVCIMKPGGEVVKPPFEMNHTADELDSLVSLINSFDEETRVVLEDTGHYHLPVASYLASHDIFVCCVNALRMKKYCAQSIRRAKTDKIDAVRIASFGITYWSELTRAYDAPKTYDELRFLARQYYQITAILVKAKVNFSNLLDQVMPGISYLLQNQKLTEFVNRYIHFQMILDMGEKKFTADYCKWAKKMGYRCNERKAAEIYTLAQNGIPSLPNSQSVKIAVREAIKVIHSTEESRNTILAQMQDLCKTLPEYSVVRDMNCIGDVLAPRIIAEFGDVRRFKNKHSLIAYAGIDAPPYQSGAFNASERKISKRGNAYLRKTGYEIMQSLIKHKPVGDPIYDFIQKKRSEGKCGKEAMIAGLNKFLRVYYGKVMELYSET
jgi:transposase